MITQRNIIMFVATLSLLGGAFAYGYHRGTINQIEKFAEKKQELQQKIVDLDTDLTLKAAEIQRLQQERKGMINDLERQALEAEGANRGGVATTGGLQRLERRWGPSPSTP